MKSLILGAVTFLLLALSGGSLAQTKETVTFMAFDVVNFRGALEAFIEEFEQANPDVDIVANFTPQLFQQFLPLLQANDLNDITFIGSPAFVPYLGSGRLESLPADFVETLGGVIYPASLGPVSRDGQVFAVPYNYYPSSGVIMYNEALWEEAGIDPNQATTWEEFMELAQMVTKKNASGQITQAGFSAQRDPAPLFFAWLLQLGGKPFNEDGTAAFNDEAGATALQLYADIYQKWQVDDYEFGDTIESFNRGQVAATIVGPWYGSILSKDHPNLSLGHLNQPPLPGVSADQPNYWPLFEVWAHLVSSEGAEKEGVWRFLEFLLQPEVAARWAEFSGEMPAVIEAQSFPQVLETPYLEPYVSALDHGVAEHIAEYFNSDVIAALDLMLESVARGQVGIEDALERAEREVNQFTSRMAPR